MKNITISMDDELAHKVSIKAAKAGKSMSRFIVETLEAQTVTKIKPQKKTLNPQQEAIERFLAGPKWDVMTEGRMPTAEERNER